MAAYYVMLGFQVIDSVEKDGKQVAIHFTRNFGANQDDLHLSMEVAWKMIDLTVAMCISPFAKSYIQYHKMEQAMEKLFIKDLKILWKSPPKSSMLYTRVYGPGWKFQAENLERCLQAVYITRPKLSRLSRPVRWTTKVNSTEDEQVENFI